MDVTGLNVTKVNGNPPQTAMTARPSLYPQGRFKDKPCRCCGTVFSPKGPSHLYCSQTCADMKNAEAYYKRVYGIGLAEYEALFQKQNGVCAICKEEGFVMADHHKAKLMVDHCHKTGRVRGLLCHNCNRALGLLKDDTTRLASAMEYLCEPVS